MALRRRKVLLSMIGCVRRFKLCCSIMFCRYLAAGPCGRAVEASRGTARFRSGLPAACVASGRATRSVPATVRSGLPRCRAVICVCSPSASASWTVRVFRTERPENTERRSGRDPLPGVPPVPVPQRKTPVGNGENHPLGRVILRILTLRKRLTARPKLHEVSDNLRVFIAFACIINIFQEFCSILEPAPEGP